MTLSLLGQYLVNGLMLGGAYALVAIGYTLIFGVLNLLHLAHGEVFMVGAYVGLVLALAGFPRDGAEKQLLNAGPSLRGHASGPSPSSWRSQAFAMRSSR